MPNRLFVRCLTVASTYLGQIHITGVFRKGDSDGVYEVVNEYDTTNG